MCEILAIRPDRIFAVKRNHEQKETFEKASYFLLNWSREMIISALPFFEGWILKNVSYSDVATSFIFSLSFTHFET